MAFPKSNHSKSGLGIFAFLAMFVIAGATALAPRALAFDIRAHCRQVGDAVRGSYEIEEVCQQSEQDAEEQISRLSIDPRIENHCREVGRAVGGSYEIMLTCVKSETAAKARLGE